MESLQDLNLNITTTHSGADALRIMEHQRIDILISDIQMRGMSGIELVRHVQGRWPLCKAIMVTAYDSFDYIYEAEKLGVVSYILKTEKSDYIISEVRRVIFLLDEKVRQLVQEREQISSLQKTVDFLKRDLFFSFLKNTNDFSVEEQKKTLEIFGFEEPFQYIYLVCGKLLDFRKSNAPTDFTLLSETICRLKMAMSGFITGKLKCCVCEDKYDMVYWIMQNGDGLKDGVDGFAWLSGMLETVQEACLSVMGIRVSLILCGPVEAEQLPDAYQKSRILIEQRGQYDPGLYSFQWEKNGISGYEVCKVDVLCAQLRRHLEKGEFDRFLELANDFCDKLSLYGELGDKDFRELYFSVALFMIEAVKSRNLQEKIGKKIRIDRLFFLESFECASNAATYLRRMANLLTASIQEEEEWLMDGITVQMQNYIKEHLSENISLQSMSDFFCYNVTYLSRLFHKKVGMKLSDYVAQCRLEEICRLMNLPDLTIQEIMERTGFHSRSYFNRFIKNMTGKTPQKLYEELRKES